ncbi:hypothetical protein [Streptomyces sp. E-08]|uniref:hypothetical protein n=1 Tax=Streptomyces sp. E-08 TaxID=3404047 RepID=UPI003CF80B91
MATPTDPAVIATRFNKGWCGCSTEVPLPLTRISANGPIAKRPIAASPRAS